MTKLQVRCGEREFDLSMAPGQSVRDALDTTELRVRAACGGTGVCGACSVQLLRGEVNPATLAEYQKLTAAERERGMRLACQLRPSGDVAIRIDDPAPPSCWTSIPAEDLQEIPAALPALVDHIYGVAVDLGTTHIRVSLWDRKRGKRIATRRGENPQGSFGADVLNRLSSALASQERGLELAKLARSAIVQAVRDILARDVGEVTPMLAEIGQVFIVGNTAMLALLAGRGVAELLAPEHWQCAVDCQPREPDSWRAQWFMPHARIAMIDPVAGFVGSDLLADLIATDFSGGPAGSLLLDVGTNTEIALWDGAVLHVTSVPGGPAFEGLGLRFGMPATHGAICHVTACAPAEGGGYRLETIGAAAPRGFCGSGLTDAIAVLRANGTLKPSGRFARPLPADGFRFDPAHPRTAITGSDVDAFQRAKAATAAAMETLLRQAQMRWEDLQRMCVCGAFGRTLDIGHAQAVGLLPPIDAGRIELFSDATLAGCERALLAENGEALFRRAGERIQFMNLAQIPAYDERYIEHLRLQAAPPIA
jgi:uncharacterized 2Fe-2S/4Fe-4S cluster protein (DUF4445 family)